MTHIHQIHVALSNMDNILNNGKNKNCTFVTIQLTFNIT